MTNEERDALIAQGWTPPVAVDPDLNMARDYAHYLLGTIFEIPSFQRAQDYFLQAIKRGRELERQKARSENNYKIKIKWEDTPEEAAARKRGMLEQFVTFKPEDAA